MGLFSEKVLSQAAQTLTLIEDTPDMISPAVMDAVTGKGNITDNIMNNLLNSFSINVNQYYEYGRDYFTDGLPEGSIGSLSPDSNKVQKVLEQLFPVPEGSRIRQDTSIIDRLDVSAFAKETLREISNWNPETNKVGYPFDNPTREYDVLLSSTELVSDTQLKLVLALYTGTGPDGKPSVSYQYPVVTITSKYTMDVLKSYYMISFTEINADGQEVGYQQYWNYDPSTNEYPELEEMPDEVYTQYMPIVPLRINNKNLTDPSLAGTPLYDTSKKLLDKVDLKMSQLNEGVNENPDIKDVDHAYVVMGISLHTDKPDSDDYLYRFFDDLQGRSGVTKKVFEDWENLGSSAITVPPINTIKISDGTYDSRIVYYYIDKESRSGSIGKVGDVAKSFSKYSGRLSGGSSTSLYYYEDPDNIVTIKKQITENSYDILTISGLLFVNNIFGGKDFLTTIEKKETDNFIIPLNLSVVSQMPLIERNTVYYDALKIVFHAYEWTKLKWYETGFFQFVVSVISIAITIYVGFDFGISSIVAAASAGALAFVSFILQQAITYVAISYGFELAADKLGIEFAAILAILAIGYGAFGSENLFNLPMADSLAFAGKLGFESTIEYGYEEIAKDFGEFSADVEAKQQELEQAQALLDTGSNIIDPLNTFTDLGMLPMESMDSFLDRSLAINQGILSVDMVSNFVDIHLTLPSVENLYG